MWVYFWLGITAIALITEWLTVEVVSFWFALGAVLSAILSVMGVKWFITFPVFLIVSLTFMFLFRNYVIKKFNGKDVRTNADAIIGKDFVLLSGIAFNKTGTIKVNGVVWNAVAENDNDVIEEGSVVKVLSLSGNKYTVKKIK